MILEFSYHLQRGDLDKQKIKFCGGDEKKLHMQCTASTAHSGFQKSQAESFTRPRALSGLCSESTFSVRVLLISSFYSRA